MSCPAWPCVPAQQPSRLRLVGCGVCWSVWLFLNHRFRRVDRFIFGFAQIVVCDIAWDCFYRATHPSKFMRVYIDSHPHRSPPYLSYRTCSEGPGPGWFAASEAKAHCFVYRCHNCECVCSSSIHRRLGVSIRMGFFVGFGRLCLITDWGAKTDWELIVNSGRSFAALIQFVHILWAAIAIAVDCFCQISSGLRCGVFFQDCIHH